MKDDDKNDDDADDDSAPEAEADDNSNTSYDQHEPPFFASEKKKKKKKNDDNNGDKESSSTTTDAPPRQQLATMRQLFSFAQTKRTKTYIVVAFCFALVNGCILPAMVFYTAEAFERLSASPDSTNFMATVREVCFIFMVLGVLAFFALTGQTAFMEAAATDMTRNLQREWFRGLMRQDMSYHDAHDSLGEASTISIMGARYKKGVGRKLASAVQYIINVLGAVIYAFYASWATSLVLVALTPLMYVTLKFLVKMNTSQTKRANATYAKAGSIVSTAVSSIRTLLALNAVNRTIDEYKQATQEALEGAVSQVWLVGLANGCQWGAQLLVYFVITLFGSWLLYDAVRHDNCDPSGTNDLLETCNPSGMDVFGALMGVTFGSAVLPQINVALESLIGARAACYTAMQVIERTSDGANNNEKCNASSPDDQKHNDPPQETSEQPSALSTAPTPQQDVVINVQGPPKKLVIDSSSEAGVKPSSVMGDLEFRNVWFAYPTRKQVHVFQGMSLPVEKGKTVALVGPSGSGKSSATALLERFYDPQDGAVLLDGIDLRELNVKWLRQQIGLVSQEPKLFATSIRDNIAAGAPEGVSQKQIEDAARQANAHEFIMTFPDGYDTQVGELGTQLSGGQRQRIAIARVLVKKPKVLILDEATSALDSESEATVQLALDKLMKMSNLTTFVIAHRLSTIRDADMIAVLNHGVIVEQGTHDELLEKRGQYFGLVKAQRTKPAEAENENGEENGVSGHADSEHETSGSATDQSTLLGGDITDPIIEFKDVHFHYPSRPDAEVFRGLNLKVKLGETLAIVGPSGQGKSTVVSLIERFYDPTQGSIEFDGVDIRELSVVWLRDQLGLVSQEPTLFDCSIAENIKYGYPMATREQVEEVAKVANAHDFIMSFPDGYDTSVGAGSTLISGGQKQRIALARALGKHTKVLLLDEATSSLDSESERIVQATLDKIMSNDHQTCIVIAHRLSTVRNADRIAVIDHGKIRELGTHDELIAMNGQYARLVSLQSLEKRDSASQNEHEKAARSITTKKIEETSKDEMGSQEEEEEEEEVDKQEEQRNAKRARMMASDDNGWFAVGAVGAILAGLFFPAWGFLFAYMIEVLYTPVAFCDESLLPVGQFCDDYYDAVADHMKEKSLKISYAFIGIIVTTVVGFVLLYGGFGHASERMNKRIRDLSFDSLMRQEVGWFDMQNTGKLCSSLADDAALIHAFCGEPIRTLFLNLASVLVGVVISFVLMWPFALLCLGILPFLAFGAEMEMAMYFGDDEGDEGEIEENSPGAIVIETVSNMRTIASLTLEEARAKEYTHALERADPHPIFSSALVGGAAGSGQFFQFWGFGMMFWWGGWLLSNYTTWSYRDFLVSMFALFFSLYGTAVAAEGAVNRDKAKRAAARIYALADRKSLIDPLNDCGKMEV